MAGTIYVVRHAKAGSRHAWAGPDADRPLTPAGIRQAEAISAMLREHPVTRIVSSPYVRCRQTMEPLGARMRLPVEIDDGLAEGAGLGSVKALIAEAGDGGLVLCSHGDVISDLIGRVAGEGSDLDHPRRNAKGSVWALELRNGRVDRGRYHLPA